MTAASRIFLLGSQHDALIEYFDSDPAKHERAAIILFRKFGSSIDGLPHSPRYVAVEVIPFEPGWITGSSATHVAFSLKPLGEIFRRCEEESLVFGFVHNHPNACSEFSGDDDLNERVLHSALKNRNGADSELISLLWARGGWQGRTWMGAPMQTSQKCHHILVLSNRLVASGYSDNPSDEDGILDRQAAAFGTPFVRVLQSLRVAIVGVGGTGSAVATLLARAGVGELVIIDPDRLEPSNLNRVRGASRSDVGKSKSVVLRDFIHSLGLSVRVSAIDAYLDLEPIAIDALSTCDVVFGCTDDQSGRDLINVALYVYGLAYIDLGLGGKVVEEGDGCAILRNHHARISTILPEQGECLHCQGVIREEWIRRQEALRENPDLSEGELEERYLSGGAESAPGIAPFVGAAADFAVANLFELIRPFRRLPGNVRKDSYCIDFVNMEVSSHAEKSDKNCPYCQKAAFLLVREDHRLNRPALGRRYEAA